MNDLAKAFNEIFQPREIPKRPRFERQGLLEDEIAMFRPDYNEAMELLDALLNGLEARFNDNLPVDVLGDFKNLRESLDEADTLEFVNNQQPEYDPSEKDDVPTEVK